MKDGMTNKIVRYFKANDLPTPITIKYVGPWAQGKCFAVTCGIIKLKKYCVYFKDDEIYSVRRR